MFYGTITYLVAIANHSVNDLKLIIITGGVLSGIGKGVLGASIGALLKENFKIVPIKCDGYLNADPGTMNPIEHGEVFVLDDGGEVDMDFGHYERFMGVNAKKNWNLTMGKIYKTILDDERSGKYLGKTVQLIPHATDEIKKQLFKVLLQEKAEIGLIEVGGTVGDMENELFIEAIRQMRREVKDNRIMFVHLTYIPYIFGSNEYKSKPTQNSVKLLNQKGIYPDMLVCRSDSKLDKGFREKVALHCGLLEEKVVSIIDLDDINRLPYFLEEQGVSKIIKNKFNLSKITHLKKKKKSAHKKDSQLKIVIAGKYVGLEDSYASIREALKHAAHRLGVGFEINLINTSEIKMTDLKEILKKTSGVIIPGGFGIRGVEGKIEVIHLIRENKIPFLGICLGMQLAVIEFARNVSGLAKANSTETKKKDLEYPVVDLLPEQKKVKDKGASMRLGGQDVLLQANTLIRKIYAKKVIRERFRHRYEVNNAFTKILEGSGLIFSGSTLDGEIKQVIELKNHPFFIGCQFHPELLSRIDQPVPLFLAFLEASLESRKN